jgi:endonuclease/exonuclease/phosphatase (EEP) superfamily protein YafD
MRIDYVYFKGKGLKVTDAKIVGEDKEHADIVVSPYPSDHRAVVATFTLTK